MKKIWNIINNLNTNKHIKNFLYTFLIMIINFIVGITIWFIFNSIIGLGKEWLICFVGYPVVLIGFFGTMFYLYNNEFK